MRPPLPQESVNYHGGQNDNQNHSRDRVTWKLWGQITGHYPRKTTILDVEITRVIFQGSCLVDVCVFVGGGDMCVLRSLVMVMRVFVDGGLCVC